MSTALVNGETQAIEKPSPSKIIVQDDGVFADLMDTGRFEHLWRVAKVFAASNMVPQAFRGKPEDCLIACQMALRLKVDPFMLMQATYVVYGKPGMEAKLAIALINTSGLFKGGLRYERVGEDAAKQSYKCRAYGVRADTGETVHGPWITWEIVKKERWDQKEGSKWMTIPSLMFDYRAATWFGRTYCPERLMGMQTVDEIDDLPNEPRQVVARTVASALAETRAALQSTPPAENVTKDGEVIDAPAEQQSDPNELTDAERAEIARKEEAEFLNRKGGK